MIPDAGDLEFLAHLTERARTADGQPPFSDQSLVDLRQGARDLLAEGRVAAALATPVAAPSPAEAEFVVDPDARGRGFGTRLLERLLARHPGELLLWAHGDHPAARALAASHGLVAVRELLRLRMALGGSPGEVSTGSTSDGSTSEAITAFRPGIDEDAWLELNARAFRTHPEQGRVTRADLDELMAEPWFSADDFLMLWHGSEDGQSALLGYCWLKVEGDVGEFYVVGVDPGHQGEGLGRRLTVAGLDRLRQRDIRSVQLYVEGDNTAAVRLYRSLGFTDDSVDIQYRARAGRAVAG